MRDELTGRVLVGDGALSVSLCLILTVTRMHGLQAGVLSPHRERLGTGAVSCASLGVSSQLTEELNKRLQCKWSSQQKSPLKQQFKCSMFSC